MFYRLGNQLQVKFYFIILGCAWCLESQIVPPFSTPFWAMLDDNIDDNQPPTTKTKHNNQNLHALPGTRIVFACHPQWNHLGILYPSLFHCVQLTLFWASKTTLYVQQLPFASESILMEDRNWYLALYMQSGIDRQLWLEGGNHPIKYS